MADVGRTGAAELAVGLPAAAVAGLLVGAIGTFKHQVGVSAATGTGPPIGLVLSLAMVVLFLTALRLTFPARWFAAAAAVGVVVAVGVLRLPGPGGSQVILANTAGLAWLALAPVAAVAVVAWPGRRRPAADAILATPSPSEDAEPL